MAAQPIQLIVPYVAGGGSDQRARLVGRYLTQYLGETVEVVNRTGAIAGHEAIASALPDGRTIGQISGEIGMMHWTKGLTDLTPADYTPLAVPFVEAAAILVRHDAPWQNLQELIDDFARRPLRGSGGPDFSVWKFALAGLLDAAGQDASRLEWTETLSGEQGMAKVIAGEADVAPITLTDAREFLQAKTARPLANMDRAPHPVFPGVPTVRQAIGVDWSVAHWRGLVAPKGLSAELRDRYVSALREVAQDAEFQKEAAASAFNLDWRFGDEFTEYMAQDDAVFGHLIRMLSSRAGH